MSAAQALLLPKSDAESNFGQLRASMFSLSREERYVNLQSAI
jgi:hypothetical protein